MRKSIFLSLFGFATILSAHTDNKYLVEIEAKGVSDRSALANLVHLDSVVGDRVFSVVSGEDFKALTKNQEVKLISSEIIGTKGLTSYYQPFVGVVDFPSEDTAYHTYDEMVSVLNRLAKDHSSLASVISIGKSVQNRDIWGLRISDDSAARPNKKAIVYMGTHHAREHLSTEVAIMFAEQMLGDVMMDQELQQLLKDVEIFVIPMINPDGAMHDIEGQRYKWWRKNRKRNSDGTFGVDLNRNYGYGWGTGGSSSSPGSEVYMGEAPFSEPETKAVRDFFKAHSNITMALSLHTFSELILYPWGGQDNGVGGKDERIFKKMANDIAAMNHYKPMQSSDLYIASGDTCDWAYGELKIFCFTFELSPSSMFGGGFYPGASVIDKVFNDNFDPMVYLAKMARNPAQALEE